MAKTDAKSIEFQELLSKAVALRLGKVPYDQIITALGHWNSVQACQKAVSTYLKRNQVKTVEDSRAESIALIEDLICELKDKFKTSKSSLIAREIRNLNHQLNQLQGNYAPTKIAATDTEGRDKPANVVFYIPSNGRDETPS